LILYAFVNNYWQAVGGRFVLGMVHGLSPISKSALTEILPKEKAPLAIGLVSAVWYLGNFVGPFMGSALLKQFDFDNCDKCYMMPSFGAAFVVFLSLLMIVFIFEETL